MFHPFIAVFTCLKQIPGKVEDLLFDLNLSAPRFVSLVYFLWIWIRILVFLTSA